MLRTVAALAVVLGATSSCERRSATASSAVPSPATSAIAPRCRPGVFPTAGSRAVNDAWLAEGLRRAAKDLDKRPDPTTRDLMNAALVALALDGDAKVAESLIARVLAVQSANGTFPWHEQSRAVSDMNALEFATQSLGPILAGYSACLRPEFVAAILPKARLAIAALERDASRVKPTYTNIWLMNAASLVLLSEAAGDADGVAKGVAELSTWRAITREDGITEFASPTYYTADLNSLLDLANFAGDPSAREMATSALRFFWADITASFFPGRREIAGAHSRDYDFLRGRGGVELYTNLAGLGPEVHGEVDLEKVALVVSELRGGYQPDATLVAQAQSTAPRVVTATWHNRDAPAEGQERYLYVTSDFAVGSTSANYRSPGQFKPLSIELASALEVPTITVVARETNAALGVEDDPYGLTKLTDKSGHRKPTHLPMHPVIAQYKGNLLATIVSDPPADEPDSLATSVLFPANEPDETLLLDGEVVLPKAGWVTLAHMGSVLIVRIGHAGAAVRLASATGCGAAPVITLTFDERGLRAHAGRLRIVHGTRSDGGNSLRECHPRVTLAAHATHVDGPTDLRALAAAVGAIPLEKETHEANASTTISQAAVGGVTLAVERTDVIEGSRHRVRGVRRAVNGVAMEFGRLTIDGRGVEPP